MIFPDVLSFGIGPYGAQDKYELFEKIYEEGMQEKKRENIKGGR